jgi:DNA end-binding protein Ku
VLWRGALRFGEIAIPVGLTATIADRAVHFRTLHRECGTPVKQQRFCPEHDRAVEDDELVKGWEVAPGQFVLVEPGELDAIAPDESRLIALEHFVGAIDVEPLLGNRSYFLTASDAAPGQRAYALLAAAMFETATVAIGRFAAWGSEIVCTIHPTVVDDGLALVLETLHLPEDLQTPPSPPGADIVRADELQLAKRLVTKLTVPFKKLELSSAHRDRVTALVEGKLAGGKQPKVPRARRGGTAPPALTADLASALRRSVRAASPSRRPRQKASA